MLSVSCWWTLIHFYQVNVIDHGEELESPYLNGIFDKVKLLKRTAYFAYAKLPQALVAIV